jgi:HSP20 family protein
MATYWYQFEEKTMNIISWSPFRDMDDIFNRYRRFASTSGDGDVGKISMDWRPTADICETDTEYLIKAELPEVDCNDVHISVDSGRVTISGERKMDKEEEDAIQHRIESFYGTFSRSFELPGDVDEMKITAKSENGMLKVHLPKTEVSKPKQIEINVK